MATAPRPGTSVPEWLRSPAAMLAARRGELAMTEVLAEYERWWQAEGAAISTAVDRMGTPWLRLYDRYGRRVDAIALQPDYWRMLYRGYAAGAVWRVFEERSLLPFYLLGHVVSFYDAGLYCPYTVSLATAVPLWKYGTQPIRERFLPQMLAKKHPWQGATWMTEAGGGSDLGAAVETVARPHGDHWLLTGEKYFCSNLGAELAVVAARPEGAPEGVRGLALFLVPRRRSDGSLNVLARRLKDKIGTRSVPTGEAGFENAEAYLMGRPEWGVYLILEVLNISRVANSVGSAALAQRAIAEALAFAEARVVFGRPLIEQPLMRRQFEERIATLCAAFALAWEAVRSLEEVWQERPPYSERYHRFRLVAHLAKYWTAEVAAQTAKWAMEVHGGAGVLGEFPVERLLREAMILPIWEGAPHRQILDGLEVMQRRQAHVALLDHLAPLARDTEVEDVRRELEHHLSLSREEQEAAAEPIFRRLAELCGELLSRGEAPARTP